MPDQESIKLTFRLEAEGDQLQVRVDAPGGEGRADSALPPAALLDEIEQHDPAQIPQAVLASVGQGLYNTLAVGEVQDLIFDTLQDASQSRQPVQFELRFDPKQVALTAYPWEMICNPRGQFLVRDGLVDLTRYITYPQIAPPFEANLRDLPLLRIISDPPSLPAIKAVQLGLMRIEECDPATFDQFSRRLLIDRLTVWGLQFDGHGALVLQCTHCESANSSESLICRRCQQSLANAKKVGALAFESAEGVNWISTGEFGSLLYNANIRLALILACDSARVGDDLIFSGLTPGLLLAGVPAVIGMQYPVLDSFANSFANAFYTVLDQEKDLLAALRAARRMNVSGSWYSPVMYLRYRRSEAEQAALKPISEDRSVDTAVPSEVQIGVEFLSRLWIRRPQTRPLSEVELRRELGMPEHAPVDMRAATVSMDLKPVEGRKLRRGEVEIQLRSTACDISPSAIKLFVDEDIDAPPAIFTAKARRSGDISVIFTVLQDGVQIYSVSHPIKAVAEEPALLAGVQRSSAAIGVAGAAIIGGTRGPATNGEMAEPPSDAPLGMGGDADFALDELAAEETVEAAKPDWATADTEERPSPKPPIVAPPAPSAMPEVTRPSLPQAQPPRQPAAAMPAETPAPRKARSPFTALAGAAAAVTMVLFVGALVVALTQGTFITASSSASPPDIAEVTIPAWTPEFEFVDFPTATPLPPADEPTLTSTPEPSPTAAGGGPSVTPEPTHTLPPTEETFVYPTNPQGYPWTEDSTGHVVVEIPADAFLMGSDSDRSKENSPVHEVVISQPFWVDAYEVTVAQYRACVDSGICPPPDTSRSQRSAVAQEDLLSNSDFDSLPIFDVTWDMANTYCHDYRGGSLPTEAQWEYVARGKEGRTFPWGEDSPTCDLTNFAGCFGSAIPVGYPEGDVSVFGVFNMGGNVAEWVADWFDPEFYAHSPQVDPFGPERGIEKVVRGGFWNDEDVAALTTYNRRYAEPSFSSEAVGFRCVIDTP